MRYLKNNLWAFWKERFQEEKGPSAGTATRRQTGTQVQPAPHHVVLGGLPPSWAPGPSRPDQAEATRTPTLNGHCALSQKWAQTTRELWGVLVSPSIDSLYDYQKISFCIPDSLRPNFIFCSLVTVVVFIPVLVGSSKFHFTAWKNVFWRDKVNFRREKKNNQALSMIISHGNM